MRLITAILAGFLTTAANAQTQPGPEGCKAAIVETMTEVYACCTTPPGETADDVAGFGMMIVGIHFRDATNPEP